MRVTFYRNIKTRSGKCPNGKEVFSSLKNDTICISRIFTYPTLTEHHHLVGRKLSAAAKLFKEIHADFLEDLSRYTKLYNQQKLAEKKLSVSPYNIFVKALCSKPEVFDDLEGPSGVKTILGENIEDWISGGHLPKVSNSNFKNADIVDGI